MQTGPYVYVVGGWGDAAPDVNVNTTQRYDLTADTWELGPEFISARADLALAATAGALYAIGGDRNGGWFFEPTKTVEWLDLADWPAGAWENVSDPIPVAFTANNAGFCTQALFNRDAAEVWSVAGLDANWFISGRTLFREVLGATCYSIYTDVPWLSVTPAAGTVPAAGSSLVTLNFDATDLTPGDHTATLVVSSNDSGRALLTIPVRLTVTGWHNVFLPLIAKR